MSISPFIPTRREFAGIFIGAALGIGGSYVVSAYFSSEKMEQALQAATKAATAAGHTQGTLEANREFERTAPDRLEEMFPSVFQAIREDAKSTGYSDGFIDGKAEALQSVGNDKYYEGFEAGQTRGDQSGYARGLRDGESRTNDIVFRLEAYIADWNNYEALVNSLAPTASDLEVNRGNSELEARLLSQSEALVQIANGLRQVHQQEAFSFNSLIGDLTRAVEGRNLPEIRRLSLAIRDSMDTKRNIYLSNKKRELEIFSSIAAK